MAEMEFNRPKIKIYDGVDPEEYENWRTMMIMALRNCEIAGIILSELVEAECSMPMSEEEKKQFVRAQRTLFSKIYLFTSDEAHARIIEYKDDELGGTKAWRAMDEKFRAEKTTRMLALKNKLFHSAMEAGKDPDIFFKGLDEKQRQLVSIGEGVKDSDLVTIVWTTMPSEYDGTQEMLAYEFRKEKLTYSALKEAIRARYQSLKLKETSGVNEGALRADVRRGGNGFGRQTYQFQGSCYGCGVRGHKEIDCPKRKGDGEAAAGGAGRRDGSGRGRGRSRGGCYSHGGRRRQDIRCHGCKEKGHKIADCPNKGDDLSCSVVAASVMPASERLETYLIDSGCSAHMVDARNKGLLTNLKPAQGVVDGVGDTALEIVAIGDLVGTVKDRQGKARRMRIKRVKAVKGLGFNLLSSGQFKQEQVEILITNRGDYIRKNGLEIPIVPRGRVFELPLKPLMNGVAGDMAGTAAAAVMSPEEIGMHIHERFGHRGRPAMRALIRMGLVRKDIKLPEHCKVCEEVKATRSSFSALGSQRKVKELGTHIHADTWGPVPGGTKGEMYVVQFTEEKSRYTEVYCMRNKAQTAAMFELYLKDLRQTRKGLKVQEVERLHSDNGREFFNHTFDQICQREDIRQTSSAAYTPEQNGIAERRWRTLNETATCLMETAGAPDKMFWPYAIRTAAYLVNRTPSGVFGLKKTPLGVLQGKEPDVSNVRKWGSAVYVYQKSGKLEPRGFQGILVGFDPANSKRFQVYNPKTDQVKWEGHVKFFENVFPWKERKNDGDSMVMEIDVDSSASGAEAVEVVQPVGANRGAGAAPAGDNSDDVGAAPAPGSGGVAEGSGPRRSYRSSKTNWCTVKNCPVSKSHHLAHVVVLREVAAIAAAKDIASEEKACQALAIAAAADIESREEADPANRQEAMASEHAEEWQKEEELELKGLKDNDTYTVVVAPPGANVLGSKFVYKVKKNETGEVVRRKVRLTAKGCSQKEGIDYDETFSPTPRAKTLMTMLAITAARRMYLRQADVVQAFLKASLKDKPVYMAMPEGRQEYGSNGQKLVWKLNKCLYGLKQAPKEWYDLLTEFLKEWGFAPCHSDPCLFIKRVNGETLMVTVYVDDLLIAGSDLELMKKFEEDISKRFEMKLLGEARWLLGMKVDYDQQEGVIELNQEAYLKQVLERCRMSNCKGVDTPMVERMVRGSREEHGFDTTFAHIVGSLMYAAMFTRPDLVQAVQSHIRHLQAVTPEHMKALKRTLRYVRATLGLGLKFGGKNSQGLELYAYSDSDWANDVETRRSTTGYVCMLNGAAVSVGSKLQATVALSSTEAEYMALCAATQDVVYMRRLLEELGVKQKGSTIIFEDNQGCIALAENPVHHQRTKHIDVRYHFIRERVESGEIKIVYVPTSEQVADILTKPLAKVKFEKFRTLMMGH